MTNGLDVKKIRFEILTGNLILLVAVILVWIKFDWLLGLITTLLILGMGKIVNVFIESIICLIGEVGNNKE